MDVYCDEDDRELIKRKCFDQYKKEYNRFPVYALVLLSFFVDTLVSAIYSVRIKSTVNQLEASKRRSSDAEEQIENGNQPRRRRRLFIAYSCQLVTRFALRILFIVLQTRVLYPSNFPSNFECALNSSAQTYDCKNQRASKKTSWTVSVAVVNGLFAFLVLMEFFWILSRSRKGKKFMEDSQFFADHLPRQEQQQEENPQQILLLRISQQEPQEQQEHQPQQGPQEQQEHQPQQGSQERQEHRDEQHESQLQASIKSMKENVIKYTERLVDLKQPILRDPGQGPKPKDLKIDEICVNLEIYEGRTNYKFPIEGSRWEQLRVYPKPADANQARFERPEDIIDLQNKNILVVGRPGIGKTILSTQLLRKWASGGAFKDEQNVETQFDVAFLLKFRRFNKLETNLDLRELLTRAETVERVDDEVWDHIIKNPTKVLLIFDGIDEMSTRSHIATEDHSDYRNNVEEKMPLHCLYNKLASGLLLAGATVLTTTRPTAASNVKHLNFDRVVEVLGFTSEKVKEYVEKFTKGDHGDARANESTAEEKKVNLWQHISTNINLFSLCYIPVNCFIICHCLLWMFLRFGRSRLPTKLTEIYSIAVRLFYFRHSDKYRYASTVNDDESFILGKFHELPSKAKSDFERLGEIAFRGLQENGRLIFESTEVQGLENCGLLHQLPNYRAGLKPARTQFCFIHLTVQEFLAAKHVTDTLSKKDDLRTFVSVHINKGTWAVVLQFVAGLLEPDPEGKVQNSDIFTELLPKDTCEKVILVGEWELSLDSEQRRPTFWPAESEQDKLLALNLCKCLYELDEKHCSIIQSKLAEINFNAINFDHHLQGPADCAAVLYVLRNAPGKLLRINFSLNSIGSLGCREIHKFLVDGDDRYVNCQLHVRKLIIPHNNITDEGAKHLAEALKHVNCKLNSLELSNNNITDEGAKHLAEALKHVNCKLNSLDLSKNMITEVGAKHLAEALMHGNCKLNSLDLSGCNIIDIGAKHLAEALKHVNCKLNSLDLSENMITEVGAKHLAEALKHVNCKLNSLDLSKNMITEVGAKHLAEALMHGNCKLNSLDLSGCNIIDIGAKHLAEALKHVNCKLNSLDLSENMITEVGAKHLAEALKHVNCKLNSLDLSENSISDENAKHLAETLKHKYCKLDSLYLFKNNIPYFLD